MVWRFFHKNWFLVGLLLVVSLLLNLYNIQWGVGYHPDELKKAVFVEKGIQDFKHPILMLQLSRLTRPFHENHFDGQHRDQLVLTGRIINAILAAMIVLLVYLIARLVMPFSWSFLAAASTAVSPILVIHAHYFKEDILFTAAALLVVYLFLRWPKFLGLGLGLAFSSHYKSALLAPLFAVFSFFRKQTRLVIFSLGLATAIFLAINYPLFSQWQVFTEGLEHEATHAQAGHDVKHTVSETFFVWHLAKSLLPGMTSLALLLSLVAVAYLSVNWRKLELVDRVMLVFVLVYYFVHEISPLKPAPDFARYVVPIVPALLYLAVRTFFLFHERELLRAKTIWFGALLGGLIVWPLSDSVRYVAAMGHDTREMAQEWLLERNIGQSEVDYEAYASPRLDEVEYWSLYMAAHNVDEFQAKGIKYLVVSSFQYERYPVGSEQWQGYQDLFEFPYTEIKPAFRSIGFSNPTLRIVDISL